MRGFRSIPIISSTAPFLVILIYVIFVYSRIIFDSPMTVLGESIKYHTYAAVALFNSLMHSGQLLFWDNQMGAGGTAIGNPFYQQTNPLIYPLMIFHQNFIFFERMYFFIHILLAAYFFYFLTRYLKIEAIAGLFGTVAFISSQYFTEFTLRDGYITDIAYITWLPLVLLLLLRALDKTSVLTAIFAGMAFSMFVHDGAGGNVYLVAIFLLAFSFFYIFLSFLKGSVSLNKRIILLIDFGKIILIFITFSFAFSAIKLLPILEFLQNSNRSEYTLKQAEGGINFKAFQELFWPILQKFFWVRDTDTITTNVFLIIHRIFYVFIFLSIFSKYKKFVATLVAVSLLAILIGAAQNLPIDFYAFFYNFFPGFKSVRLPPRVLVYLWFILPLLAAIGLDWLMKMRYQRRSVLQVLPIFSAIFVLTVLPIIASQSQKVMYDARYFTYIPSQVDQALKKIAVGNEDPYRVLVTYYGTNFQTNTLPMYDYAAVTGSGYSDMSMNIYNDARPYYYDGYGDPNFNEATFNDFFRVASKKWSILNTRYLAVSEDLFKKDYQLPENKFVKEVQVLPRTQFEPKARVFEVLNVRSRLSFIPNGLLYIGEGAKTDKYNVDKVRKIIFDDKFNLYTNTIFTSPTPYVDEYSQEVLANFKGIILGDYKVHNSTKLDKLLEEYKSNGGEIFTDTLLVNNINEENSTKDSIFTISKLKEEPGRLDLNFSNKEKGFFVYSNLYYPGWEAFLDGEKVEVYMADSYVKGVVIPTVGLHKLSMVYNPRSFKLGLAITLFAFLTVIYLLLHRRKSVSQL